MNDVNLKHYIKNIPEDEMPVGHLERFQQRLNSEFPLQKKLWNLQRYLTAASIALFITGVVLLIINREQWYNQMPLLSINSSDLNETEAYLKNEINNRIRLLTETGRFDRAVIEELNSEDESFHKMCIDLRRNPCDVRLTCAVLETYQLRLEVLDNMIEKVR